MMAKYLHDWCASDKLYNGLAARNCVERHRYPFYSSKNTEPTSVCYKLVFRFQDVFGTK